MFKDHLIICHMLFVVSSVNHFDGRNNVFSHSKLLNQGVAISNDSLMAYTKL